jgi:hypothetical protein
MNTSPATQLIAKKKKTKLQNNLLIAAIVASNCSSYTIEGRLANRKRKQMVWAERVDSLTSAEFTRRYRIDLEGFNDILEKIRPALESGSCKSVPPELKLSMALRWVAGGSYLDVADLHGVNPSTFYGKCLWPTIHAIDEAYELPLLHYLEETKQTGSFEAFENLAEEFDKKSNGMVVGCIGALDGLAVKIEKPDVTDPSSYYCRKGESSRLLLRKTGLHWH